MARRSVQYHCNVYPGNAAEGQHLTDRNSSIPASGCQHAHKYEELSVPQVAFKHRTPNPQEPQAWFTDHPLGDLGHYVCMDDRVAHYAFTSNLIFSGLELRLDQRQYEPAWHNVTHRLR